MSDPMMSEESEVWTWPERLAAAALLAILLGVTAWLVWARHSARPARGDRPVAVTGAAGATTPAGVASGLPGPADAASDTAGPDGRPGAGETAASPPGGAGAKSLMVHVAGAVKNPGVYPLPSGARVVDALKAAGGRRDDAREDLLNLALPLTDGDKVYVPTSRDVAAAGSAGSGGSGGPPGQPTPSPPGWPPAVGKVDVNRADLQTLDALPGVGPSLASAIVRYRQEHGPFQSVDDLENVPGIGPAKLASLRDLVVVR